MADFEGECGRYECPVQALTPPLPLSPFSNYHTTRLRSYGARTCPSRGLRSRSPRRCCWRLSSLFHEPLRPRCAHPVSMATSQLSTGKQICTLGMPWPPTNAFWPSDPQAISWGLVRLVFVPIPLPCILVALMPFCRARVAFRSRGPLQRQRR